jgi:hypothetical protein
MFEPAFKRATDLAAIFESNPFAAAHVFSREVHLATSLPILQATPEYRSFILTLSAWTGALQACRYGYWEVVEPLVKGACNMSIETRGLWRLSQDFMMFLLQVMHSLKEPTAEGVAAAVSSIRMAELHGDEETHWRTFLDECAAGNAPAYVYTPAKQRCDFLCYSCVLLAVTLFYTLSTRLRVVPVSSVIPSATSKKLNITDFFSGEAVRGQEEWLPVPVDSLSLAVSGQAP